MNAESIILTLTIKKVYNVKQRSGQILALMIHLQKYLPFREVQEKQAMLLKIELVTL